MRSINEIEAKKQLGYETKLKINQGKKGLRVTSFEN